jgi:hypothetical protein
VASSPRLMWPPHPTLGGKRAGGEGLWSSARGGGRQSCDRYGAGLGWAMRVRFVEDAASWGGDGVSTGWNGGLSTCGPARMAGPHVGGQDALAQAQIPSVAPRAVASLACLLGRSLVFSLTQATV